MLGTVIRPLGDWDEYDADMVGTLRAVSMTEKFQANLKADVGHEVRLRASAHGMQEPVDGRRGRKFDYAKGTRFHCDILASVPASVARGALSIGPGLLSPVPELAGRTLTGITDREHPDYDRISPSWTMANPVRCELWFKERQRQFPENRLRTRTVQDCIGASVEELLLRDVRTPVQDTNNFNGLW